MRSASRWVLLSLLAAVAAGCNQQPDAVRKAMSQASKSSPTPASTETSSGPSSTVVAQGSGGAVQGVRRSVEQVDVGSELRQVGIFVKQANALNGKPPQSEKEVVNEIRRDMPATAKRFEEQYYVYVPRPSMGSADVIVYEKDSTKAGQRYVLLGDGSVQIMGADDLKKAVPNLK